MNDISNDKDDHGNRDQSKSLKIAETNSKFVGKGMALVDPKVMEMMSLSPGNVIEIKDRYNTILCISTCSSHGEGCVQSRNKFP